MVTYDGVRGKIVVPGFGKNGKGDFSGKESLIGYFHGRKGEFTFLFRRRLCNLRKSGTGIVGRLEEKTAPLYRDGGSVRIGALDFVISSHKIIDLNRTHGKLGNSKDSHDDKLYNNRRKGDKR